MSELIPVRQEKVNGEEIPTVDARRLWEFLEVKRQFADWVKDQVERGRFVENRDFVLVSQKSEAKGKGGDRRSVDYHLTLKTAEHIAMMSNTDKGHEVREYFIECENRLKKLQPQFNVPGTFAEALMLAAKQQAELENQKKALAEAAPKVEAFDLFIDGQNYRTVAHVGKELRIVENRLFQFLRDQGILMSTKADWNVPYQEHISAGYFTVKVTTRNTDGGTANFTQPLISAKGQAFIAGLWKLKAKFLPQRTQQPSKNHPLSVFLRKRREELGLSTRDVEKKANKGISYGYLTQLETNWKGFANKVDFDYLYVIGKVYDVDPMHLYRLSRGQDKVQNA